MTTTSLADWKNRLSEIVQSVRDTHQRFVITKNGQPAGVLIWVGDLESLEETLEILSDPRLLAGICKAEQEEASATAGWASSDPLLPTPERLPEHQ
jgi:prevent-host-death family protein